VRFARVRSLLGVEVSGLVGPAGGEVALAAWRDCTVVVNGETLVLRKGETRELVLGPVQGRLAVL
jgi:hypothetical protein